MWLSPFHPSHSPIFLDQSVSANLGGTLEAWVKILHSLGYLSGLHAPFASSIPQLQSQNHEKTCCFRLRRELQGSVGEFCRQEWRAPHPATTSGASPSISESQCCLSSRMRREFSLHLCVLLNYFRHGLDPRLCPPRYWQHWKHRKISAAKLPVDSVRKTAEVSVPMFTLLEGTVDCGCGKGLELTSLSSPHAGEGCFLSLSTGVCNFYVFPRF